MLKKRRVLLPGFCATVALPRFWVNGPQIVGGAQVPVSVDSDQAKLVGAPTDHSPHSMSLTVPEFAAINPFEMSWVDPTKFG